MKKTFVLIISLCFLNSCKITSFKNSEKKNNTAREINLNKEDDCKVYFKASGKEPFWEIIIGKEKTFFSSATEGKEKIIFQSVEPVILTMGSNTKTYKLNNSAFDAIISIHPINCQDSMPETISYKVTVEIKNNSDTDYLKLDGCGKYITDYRLHDIWVLEELNGYKVFMTDFEKQLPQIEIHAEENSFMGFGGCNTINGKIFFEKGRLRFMNIISTLMACPKGNKEDDFTKALQNTTFYSIKNNRLNLSNASGNLLIFKKVD